MTYTLDIDPLAEHQIAALPAPTLAAVAEALAVLELVPTEPCANSRSGASE